MLFVWGKSAPNSGRYGGLKFGFLAYFGLLLLGTLSTDFRFFEYVRQPHGLSSDPENFVNIEFVEFEQCAVEFGKIALRTFRQVRRRYNGVMVTAPGGSSVTVRDRPPNVLGVE